MNKSSNDKPTNSTTEASPLKQESNANVIQRTTSEALFAGQREFVIEHAGEDYRLRITSKGKLILTK